MPAYQHTCAACKFVVGGLEHYMAHSIPEALKAAHGICVVRFQDPLEQKKCSPYIACNLIGDISGSAMCGTQRGILGKLKESKK